MPREYIYIYIYIMVIFFIRQTDRQTKEKRQTKTKDTDKRKETDKKKIDKRTDKEDLQTERLTRRREGGGGVIVRFDHSRWTHVTDDHFKAVLLDNPSLMIIRLIDKLIQTKSS